MFSVLETMSPSWALSVTATPLRLEFVLPRRQKCMSSWVPAGQDDSHCLPAP